jgi:hypothetical protein
MTALSPSQSDRHPLGLWSLWEMLQSYLPIYKIAIELERLRRVADAYQVTSKHPDHLDAPKVSALLAAIRAYPVDTYTHH